MGPKRSANASCWSSSMCWSRKKSTRWSSSACRSARDVVVGRAAGGDRRRVTSAPMASVSGRISIVSCPWTATSPSRDIVSRLRILGKGRSRWSTAAGPAVQPARRRAVGGGAQARLRRPHRVGAGEVARLLAPLPLAARRVGPGHDVQPTATTATTSSSCSRATMHVRRRASAGRARTSRSTRATRSARSSPGPTACTLFEVMMGDPRSFAADEEGWRTLARGTRRRAGAEPADRAPRLARRHAYLSDERRPFAPGSVSLRLYPHNDLGAVAHRRRARAPRPRWPTSTASTA